MVVILFRHRAPVDACISVLFLLLAGCSSQPTAPPSDTVEVEQPAVIIQPTPAVATLSAVSSLVREGWDQYHAGQWLEAIATAERGLRIQRRFVELYLLLARAYLELGNIQQTQAFARQGLRFSQAKDDRVRQELQALLASISP